MVAVTSNFSNRSANNGEARVVLEGDSDFALSVVREGEELSAYHS